MHVSVAEHSQSAAASRGAEGQVNAAYDEVGGGDETYGEVDEETGGQFAQFLNEQVYVLSNPNPNP
jgi:hypothetical protein